MLFSGFTFIFLLWLYDFDIDNYISLCYNLEIPPGKSNCINNTPFDKYFLQSKSGIQIYKRLLALDKNLPIWINKLYEEKGSIIIIDNIFSGPGRDMIRVLQKNPDLKTKVHVRNIDIDKKAIEIGKNLINKLNYTKYFTYECKPYHKAKSRKADLIILVGVLCPLRLHISERILNDIKRLLFNRIHWTLYVKILKNN